MSQPNQHKDSVFKRLILFPLALFYMAVLVIAGWPRQLSPSGRVIEAMKLAANNALAQLAIQPAVNVFTGRTGGDRTATVRTCFKIVGRSGRQREVLYDSLSECEARERSKDPYASFHNQYLNRGLARLKTRGAHLDRNAPPLNVLFSIFDYHCHHLGEDRFTHLVLISRYQRLNLDSGDINNQVTIEGVHQCKGGRWDPILAPAGPDGTRLHQPRPAHTPGAPARRQPPLQPLPANPRDHR